MGGSAYTGPKYTLVTLKIKRRIPPQCPGLAG